MKAGFRHVNIAMLEYTLDAGDLELPGGTYPIVPLEPPVLVVLLLVDIHQ